MTGRDRRIDPRTRDYVSDGQGGVETAAPAASAIYHAIATQRGSVIIDPSAGCRLADLKVSTADAAPLAVHVVELALQPLVTDGQIRDVSVSAAL
ncbi:MAG: hypothetical protein AAGC55_03080, partial [Myxococcota bacterium]